MPERTTLDPIYSRQGATAATSLKGALDYVMTADEDGDDIVIADTEIPGYRPRTNAASGTRRKGDSGESGGKRKAVK